MAGIENFLLNKHYLPEQIDDLAQTLKPFCQSIRVSDETEKLLGSGGALWKARGILRRHEFFIIANGDEVMIPKDPQILKKLVRHFKDTDSLCTLLTTDHQELLKSLKPVWTLNGEVKAFGMEKPDSSFQPVHYTGYKVFSRKILDWLPDGESNIFYEVLVDAISQGQTVTHLHINNCPWFETGNPDSFLNAGTILGNQFLDQVNERRVFFNLEPIRFENNQTYQEVLHES